MRKYLFIFIIALVGLFALETCAYAGSLSISASSYQVEPGETVTIFISGNNATGYVAVSASNISINTSPIWVEDSTVSLTGTVGGSGTASVTVAPIDLADSETSEEIYGSKSISISISSPEVESEPTQEFDGNDYGGEEDAVVISNPVEDTSSNNKKEQEENEPEPELEETPEPVIEEPLALDSLIVKGYTLNPAFSKDKKEYNLVIKDLDVFSLEIEAKANKEDCSIVVSGNEQIKVGDNSITISVKTNDDKEKVEYKLNVKKEVSTYKEEFEQAKTEISNLSNEIKNKDSNIFFYKIIIAVMVVTVIGLCGIIIYFNRQKLFKK